MTTEIYYFAGKSVYAMPYVMDKEFQNYKVGVALDESSLALFEESGCQNEFKDDKEFGKYVNFRRKHSQVFGDELKTHGPPPVSDKDGEGIRDLIGNGSDVIVKVAVFDTKRGKGHRLEAVKVMNLIPYEGGGQAMESHVPKGIEAF